MIGRTVKVTQEINNTEQTGKAVYDGQEWTARSADDNTVIEAGQPARVVRIEGVKDCMEKEESNMKGIGASTIMSIRNHCSDSGCGDFNLPY